MESLTIDTLVQLAEQLNEDEQDELIRRLETLRPPPRQRPSETLRTFHVEHFPEHLTLRREDEYGDEQR